MPDLAMDLLLAVNLVIAMFGVWLNIGRCRTCGRSHRWLHVFYALAFLFMGGVYVWTVMVGRTTLPSTLSRSVITLISSALLAQAIVETEREK